MHLINTNPSQINSVISTHGSTRYGSKTRCELHKSVEILEKGTVLITADSVDKGCPGLLLYPTGQFEVMSPSTHKAYTLQHKPAVLVHRTLRSLDSTPTRLSEPDFTAIKEC
ncbi:hypothetical protein IAR50_006889 [Cryptococcus sp. DSM 104548]